MRAHRHTYQLSAARVEVEEAAQFTARSRQERAEAMIARLQVVCAALGMEPTATVMNLPGRWDFMVSYTQRNAYAKALANKACGSLQQRGHTVWLDTDIPIVAC